MQLFGFANLFAVFYSIVNKSVRIAGLPGVLKIGYNYLKNKLLQ